MKPTISISTTKVLRLLISVAVLLAGLSIVVSFYETWAASPNTRSDNPNLGFSKLFDLRKEESIATWYSSFLLLLCSALLALIFASKKQERGRYVRHWMGLSIVFLYLSVDESSTIHEKLGPVTRTFLGYLGLKPGGLLSHAWVIPAGALVLVFVLAYARFFLCLPSKQKLLFFVSGFLYVGGALGVEMLNGLLISVYGRQQGVPALILPTFEESLEIAGIVVFAYALLSYIGSWLGEVGFEFKNQKGA